MLSPSFYAIYKQGRLGRRSVAESEVIMHQKERFSVAALAFVLQHDGEFRRHFLEQICHSTRDPGIFQIDLEVSGCGDLVLQTIEKDQVYVIEFKIDAALQEHNQSPHNELFFKSGYGANIIQTYGLNATYIVIQNNPCDYSDVQTKNPSCKSKTWEDIARISSTSPIVNDLFKSFAALGISAFLFMSTKHIMLGSSTLNATRMYQLLNAVTEKIGFKKATIDFSLKPDATGGYFGLDFYGNTSPIWDQLVEPIKSIGWFGYDDNFNTKGQNLIVWFYCGSNEARSNIQNTILGKLGDVDIRTEDEGNVKNLMIVLPSEKSLGDQEWFLSIFNALVAPC